MQSSSGQGDASFLKNTLTIQDWQFSKPTAGVFNISIGMKTWIHTAPICRQKIKDPCSTEQFKHFIMELRCWFNNYINRSISLVTRPCYITHPLQPIMILLPTASQHQSRQPESQALQRCKLKSYLPVQQHAALGNAREALDINIA